jgi:lysyl-tRNA synthetase class 2
VEAAKAAGRLQLQWKDRTADPYAAPERLSVADAFTTLAGIDLLATLDGDEGDREKLAARRAPPAFKSRTTTTGRTCSAACWSSGSSRGSALASDLARPISVARGGVGAALNRHRASRSVSSSMPAVSNSPTALPRSPTRPSNAAVLQDAMAERQRRYGEQYPIDETFCRTCRHATQQRHRARLSTGW